MTFDKDELSTIKAALSTYAALQVREAIDQRRHNMEKNAQRCEAGADYSRNLASKVDDMIRAL